MLQIEIARLTCIELWQSRTLRSLLVVAATLPVVAVTISSLFMRDIGKVYVDGIVASSQLLAVVFLLFLAVPLLSRDIFDKVCYILLTPPVKRYDYLIGRFLGIAFVFLVILLVLLGSGLFAGWLYLGQLADVYQSGYSWLLMFQLIFFHFFQYISILGAIFFIVSWSSGDAETMLFTVFVLIFAWVFPPVLKAMQNPDVAENTPEAIMLILQGLYEVLPHLDGADIALRLAHGVSIGVKDTVLYTSEHILYSVVFFWLAAIIFERRDL